MHLGTLCKRGHDHEGTGMSMRKSSGDCIKCHALTTERWKAANKESILKREREWRGENRERVREYKRKDYKNRREAHRAAGEKYYKKNRDKILKRTSQWQKDNREARNEYARACAKKGSLQMTDRYVRSMLTVGSILGMGDIPQELVDLKREHLKLRRTLWGIKSGNTK